MTDEAMRAAGFSLPETLDAGDPSIETLVRVVIDARARELLQPLAELCWEVEALRTRIRARASLHTYRGGPAHYQPRQAS
jgi:hypothetical protein